MPERIRAFRIADIDYTPSVPAEPGGLGFFETCVQSWATPLVLYFTGSSTCDRSYPSTRQNQSPNPMSLFLTFVDVDLLASFFFPWLPWAYVLSLIRRLSFQRGAVCGSGTSTEMGETGGQDPDVQQLNKLGRLRPASRRLESLRITRADLLPTQAGHILALTVKQNNCVHFESTSRQLIPTGGVGYCRAIPSSRVPT